MLITAPGNAELQLGIYPYRCLPDSAQMRRLLIELRVFPSRKHLWKMPSWSSAVPGSDVSEAVVSTLPDLPTGDRLSIYQPRPLLQDRVDLVSHLGPRNVTEQTLRQQVVVTGVGVADAGGDGEYDGLGVEDFGRR